MGGERRRAQSALLGGDALMRVRYADCFGTVGDVKGFNRYVPFGCGGDDVGDWELYP
jgi:hypothetical protein